MCANEPTDDFKTVQIWGRSIGDVSACRNIHRLLMPQSMGQKSCIDIYNATLNLKSANQN